MPIKKGDFAILNYSCRIKESGELVETTIEEEAQKNKLGTVQEMEQKFEPKFNVVES